MATTSSRRRPGAPSGSWTTSRSLQQWTDATAATDVRLFKPRPAYRTQAFGRRIRRRQPARGQERARRRPHRLLAGEGAGGRRDAWRCATKAGAVVRRFTTRKPEADAPPSLNAPPGTLTVKAGLNRLVWNLRHDQVVPVPGLYVFGSLQGRRALPGDYQVRLTAGGRTLTAAADDPDGPARDDAALRAADAGRPSSSAWTSELNDLHRAVIRLRDVRSAGRGPRSRARRARRTATRSRRAARRSSTSSTRSRTRSSRSASWTVRR